MNDGLRNSRSGSIGCVERASMARKATSATAAPANSATICVLPQPTSLPRSSASTSRKRPAVSAIWPGTSTGGVAGSRDSWTLVRVIHRQKMPIGMLIRKIHCQSRPLVSAPPTSGPMANEAPMVAP